MHFGCLHKLKLKSLEYSLRYSKYKYRIHEFLFLCYLRVAEIGSELYVPEIKLVYYDLIYTVNIKNVIW